MTTLETRLTEFVNNDEKPIGYGRMLRKEDPRLIRGQGNFVDDVQLPGMLHMAILRSPVAHAKINSIDISAAAALPGVVAVVTGADLAAQGLAWMPTLSNDVQAVLATDTSPVPGTGDNLLTFMANRLNMSFSNLNCQDFGLNNPITVTLNGAGSAIAATFNTTQQTANNTGAKSMPAAGQRMGRHHHMLMNPSGM